MEGIWFYWLTWIGWTIITFFMVKGKSRDFLAFLTLLLLNTAHFNLTIFGLPISLGFLILLFLSYFLAAKNKFHSLLYLTVCMLIVGLAYISFYLISLYDPVWIIMNQGFMLAILLTYIVILLVKQLNQQITLFILGSCYGEIAYQFILKKFQFPHLIGSLSFFDFITFGITCITVWYGISQLFHFINQLSRKQAKERLG